jgi:hypothetical protein
MAVRISHGRLRRKHYESTLKGLEFLEDAKCTIKGLTGQRHLFRFVPAKGKPRRAHEVLWGKSSAGYLLTMSVEESAYEAMKPSFTALIESFEDLELK